MSILPILFADAPAYARQSGLVVAAVIIAFSIWQYREQRARVKNPEAYFAGTSERDFKFLKRQAYRRLQLSGLAGIAGALILGGVFLPPSVAPTLWTLIWLGAILFVAWATLLAAADAVAIWAHFAGERGRESAEKILLEYQIRKADELREKKAAREKNDSGEKK